MFTPRTRLRTFVCQQIAVCVAVSVLVQRSLHRLQDEANVRLPVQPATHQLRRKVVGPIVCSRGGIAASRRPA